MSQDFNLGGGFHFMKFRNIYWQEIWSKCPLTNPSHMVHIVKGTYT